MTPTHIESSTPTTPTSGYTPEVTPPPEMPKATPAVQDTPEATPAPSEVIPAPETPAATATDGTPATTAPPSTLAASRQVWQLILAVVGSREASGRRSDMVHLRRMRGCHGQGCSLAKRGGSMEVCMRAGAACTGGLRCTTSAPQCLRVPCCWSFWWCWKRLGNVLTFAVAFLSDPHASRHPQPGARLLAANCRRLDRQNGTSANEQISLMAPTSACRGRPHQARTARPMPMGIPHQARCSCCSQRALGGMAALYLRAPAMPPSQGPWECALQHVSQPCGCTITAISC